MCEFVLVAQGIAVSIQDLTGGPQPDNPGDVNQVN